MRLGVCVLVCLPTWLWRSRLRHPPKCIALYQYQTLFMVSGYDRGSGGAAAAPGAAAAAATTLVAAAAAAAVNDVGRKESVSVFVGGDSFASFVYPCISSPFLGEDSPAQILANRVNYVCACVCAFMCASVCTCVLVCVLVCASYVLPQLILARIAVLK